jgi:hypothetical protein
VPLAVRLAIVGQVGEVEAVAGRVVGEAAAVLGKLAEKDWAKKLHAPAAQLSVLLAVPEEVAAALRPDLERHGVPVDTVPAADADRVAQYVSEFAEIALVSAAHTEVVAQLLAAGLLVVAVDGGDLVLRAAEPDALGRWRPQASEPYSRESVAERLQSRLCPPLGAEAEARLAWFLDQGPPLEAAGIGTDCRGAGPIRHAEARSRKGLFSAMRDLLVPQHKIEARLRDENDGPVSDDATVALPERVRAVPALDRLHAAHLRADAIATRCGERHRSTIVGIYLLAALALVLAAGALAVADAAPLFAKLMTLAELGVLGLIWLLVRQNNRTRRAARWRDARVLAELLRPMPYLALLGRSLLPAALRERVVAQGAVPHAAHGSGRLAGWLRRSFGLYHDAPEAQAWVLAYFEAVRRWAGAGPTAPLSAAELTLAQRAVLVNLVEDQRTYHRLNACRMEMLAERLEGLSALFFIATIVCVVVKLALKLTGAAAAGFFGWLAVLLPAIAAAAFAIRAQCEVEIMALRSRAMLRRLTPIARMLAGPTLTAEQLATTMRQVGEHLVHDVAGWAEIFQAKKAEPG